MAKKVRIYELAKEYNMPAKEMVAKLKDEFGLDIKSHMSVLSGDDLALVRSYFEEDKKEAKEEKKAPKKNTQEAKKKKRKKTSLHTSIERKRKIERPRRIKAKRPPRQMPMSKLKKTECFSFQNQFLLRPLQTKSKKIQIWL